jgi:4'-phosphopantetheinyl transferase
MRPGPLTDAPRSLSPGIAYLVLENIRELSLSLERLVKVLSQAERERVARYRFEDDRLRSQVAWGLLRILLGRIRGEDPRDIEFVRNEFQKPLLRTGPSFSMAHSGDWVLLGVAPDGRFGIDVEAPRILPNLFDLARVAFSMDEISELRSYPEADRLKAFFRGWTRKEAFAKAIGGGLSVPLKQFTVTLAPEVDEALRWVAIPSEENIPWRVRPLPEMPGALSALSWDQALEDVQWVDPGSLEST